MGSSPNLIVVNGIGRCGTRLLHAFLQKKLKLHNFCIDLKKLDSYRISKPSVLKTHSPYPVKNHKHNVKFIFMYGNIYNTVLSFKKAWDKKHNGFPNPLAAKNFFMSEDDKIHKPLEQDVFKYKRHFDNWYKPHNYPVLFVRYETMYNNLEKILEFSGLSSSLAADFPKKKPRTTDWTNEPQHIKNKLVEIYGDLDEYVNELPNIKEWV